MASRPYNPWPQANAFAAQQPDFNFYSTNDRQQQQQPTQQSFSALYDQTASSLTNVFGDPQQQSQGAQYAASINAAQNGGQPQGVYTLTQSQSQSQSQSPSPNLSLHTASLQPYGSMIHDSPGPMQNQFPKGPSGPGVHQPPSAHYSRSSTSGSPFHQSKRSRHSNSQEDGEHDGELNAEKESGKKQ